MKGSKQQQQLNAQQSNQKGAEDQESWFNYNKSAFLFHYADPESVQLLSEDDPVSPRNQSEDDSQEDSGKQGTNDLKESDQEISTSRSQSTATSKSNAGTQYPPPSQSELSLAGQLKAIYKQEQTQNIAAPRSRKNSSDIKKLKSAAFKAFPSYFAKEGKLSNGIDRSTVFVMYAVVMLVALILSLSVFMISTGSLKDMMSSKYQYEHQDHSKLTLHGARPTIDSTPKSMVSPLVQDQIDNVNQQQAESATFLSNQAENEVDSEINVSKEESKKEVSSVIIPEHPTIIKTSGLGVQLNSEEFTQKMTNTKNSNPSVPVVNVPKIDEIQIEKQLVLEETPKIVDMEQSKETASADQSVNAQ